MIQRVLDTPEGIEYILPPNKNKEKRLLQKERRLIID